MEGLSRTNRIFILVLICGVFFTYYFIYDFHWRNGHLVSSPRTIETGFPLHNNIGTQHVNRIATTSSIARRIQTNETPKQPEDEPKAQRIKERKNSTSSNSHGVEDNDLKPFEKDVNQVNTGGVDSIDKLGSSNSVDFISEVGVDSLIQKSGNDIDDENQLRRRLPNAIIIGVKKGGTRALLEILKIHPDVRACNTEVHFFDRDHNYKRGLDWYRTLMPRSLPHEITLEKSPAYFVTKIVPKRVYRMSKSVKLLVVVRDPTRRAISDYTQSMVKKPFLAAFETFAVEDLKNKKVKESWRKLKIGLYDEHLKKWLEYFPLEQFHFVSGEELVKNPASEIKLVERFLNLKPFIKQKNFFFNETKGFYCLIGKISQSGLKSKPNCMGKTKGRIHPAVNSEVLKLLHEYYKPHNLNFYKMINRDFGWP